MQFSTQTKVKTWTISIIALLLFIVPVYFNGQWTIILGIFADYILGNLETQIPAILAVIMAIFLIITIYGTLINRNAFSQSQKMKDIFVLDWLWFTLRVLGTLFAGMVVLGLGPEAITSDATGGTMMYSLVPILATWLLLAAFLMPLLMNFGLMEFIGTFLEPVIRPLYRVPGRSSIDALASWMGSSPVGVMITTQQYEKGFYTKREAMNIATNFSVLSIPFSLVIASFIGIEEYFLQFYMTMAIACILTALVMVRIPPLSKKEDTYYEVTGKQIDDRDVESTMLKTATTRAYKRADESDGPKGIIKDGTLNVVDIYGGLIPVVIAIGTLALIVAEYTPVFTYLSYPVQLFLELINVPEAAAAAPAFIIGVTDMFLPSVIGSGIDSMFTKFLIAVMSLVQIIYFSEVGALLLKSKIPVSVWELLAIFILRTIISFPIIYVLALLFVGY
ncbi:YjiH family protein [Salinicoccus sp. ID82-1]|uniref:YjiH family protein n=1 Tax=Salinicoccus sp. ID82-1 TaxID=2820269 RepID=UPI001F3C2C4B|nr:YjiH family protein [Salinicoccus sp. ID82-1]MCG1009668.1 YjiH family protein [Salinicoccus sp. ID82-1]